MDFIADVYQLTQEFMNDYPEKEYPELMYKVGRPYNCLLVDTHCSYLICIPFRSHINHKNAFMFQDTQRSSRTKSGLDYTKIVLVDNESYLDNRRVVVDQDEYVEVQKNLEQIAEEAIAYVDGYIKHITKRSVMHPKQFERKYKYSTLPYFHDIMGIKAPQR